jgi:hypothetical protein
VGCGTQATVQVCGCLGANPFKTKGRHFWFQSCGNASNHSMAMEQLKADETIAKETELEDV